MKQGGKFVKIQDGVIIRQDSLKGYKREKYDPRGVHYYVAVFNRKNMSYDLYPTSHYVDPARAADVRNKRAILMNIEGGNGLSTVYGIPRTRDVGGHYFKDESRMTPVGCLTDYQMKRLKSFIKTRQPKKTKK